MKISPFALAVVVALLAVGSVTAFVPTSSRIEQGFCIPTIQHLPASTTATTTTCFASEVDIEGTATTSVEPAPSSPITFPFSDRQVRFAYDEWRLIYNKGDYDAERFENFKTNHKTLTISNLKARAKAAADGRPVPQWMSLNGYVDYSLDEYESMMRGEQPVANNVDQSMAYGQDEQPIRATQAVQGGDSSSSMNYNNGQVREYQDQFGRTIRSTQALTQDDPLASASSFPTMSVDSNYANNIGDDDDDESSQGTLIIPKGEDDNEISQQRGTQVIGTNNADVRGTQVIMPNGAGAGTTFGTQVINEASGSRGTQVLQSNGSNSFGTQVLQSSSVPGEEPEFEQTDGTQIIPKNEGDTQLIPKSADGGTQIVSKSADADSAGDKDDSDSLFDIFGSIFGDSGSSNDSKDEDDINEVGKRGTMVIKRSIKAPERKPLKNPFSFFDSSGTYIEDEEETEIEEETKASNSNDFFGFLSSPKDDSTATERAATADEEEESKTGGGGIFSLFGGNVKSSNPRKVRTSISLKKETGKKSQGFQKKRKTNLIPDATENETGVPPILSFFGGAKKVDEEENARNPNARATLIVKKPKKFSLFSSAKKTEGTQAISPSNNPNPLIAAQLDRQKEFAKKAAIKNAETAKEREALRAERLQKQLDAKQKREAEAQARALKGKGGTQAVTTTTKTSNSSPFSFFGAMGKQADPPTLKRWRQNRDGTITGMIYDSKSFVDGTRITTSPVARGAKNGTVVKTSGGSQYSLT